MRIGADHPAADAKRCRPAQRHVLADGGDRIRDRGRNGDAADLGVENLRNVAADIERDLGDHLDQALELFVARDKVGLGIDLDHRGLLAVSRDRNADQTFRGNAAGLLRRLRQALLAQPVDCGFDVTASLVQCLLAVHHARAGLVAQVLDHGCRDRCHFEFLRMHPAAASRMSRKSGNRFSGQDVRKLERQDGSRVVLNAPDANGSGDHSKNYSASAVSFLAWATQASARPGSPTSSPIWWAVSWSSSASCQ